MTANAIRGEGGHRQDHFRDNRSRKLGTCASSSRVAGRGFVETPPTERTSRSGPRGSFSGAGVRFAACENTMRRMNLKMEDLMTFATIVDSGVAEVVRKQESGWSHIKSGS